MLAWWQIAYGAILSGLVAALLLGAWLRAGRALTSFSTGTNMV